MLNSKFDINSPEWIDRVFENRNKSYGAYDLRKHSARSMVRALSIMIFSLAVIFGVSTLLMGQKPPSVDVDKGTPVINSPVNVAPDATKANKTKKSISATGTTGSGAIFRISNDNKGNDGLVENKDVDVKPMLAGGAETWARFLESNLHYPAVAREQRVSGKVETSFIVERDGKLSDITIDRRAGHGFDEEALRVLKMSPRWIPGKQNGQTIRVKYSLPINFNIQLR